MELIYLVIVKHENKETAYLFETPPCILNAGDLVLVKTKRGFSHAMCMCNNFVIEKDSDAYKEVLKRMGASEPLSKVVGIYHLERYDS